MELLKKDIKEYTDHFSKDLSPDIKKYAVDEVFKSSRYIFTRRIGKQQYGYCTNCHKEFKTDRFTHNTKEECPGCKSICIVKASGLGRKKMIDEAYFVYYEKSVINSKAIVARGIYAVRDYSEEYRNIETKYLVKVLYLFDVGHGGEMIGRYGYYSSDKTMKEYGYEKCKSIYSLASRYYQSSSKIIIECSIQSIKEAVKDTPFQYSTWESYSFGDMVNFFGLFAKYPCVEYLTKLGFNEIVREKIVGNKTYSCINWRGKSLNTVVKLTKKEIDAIKSRNKDIYPFLLKLYQISKNDGSNLTIEEIEDIEREYEPYFEDLKIALKYTSIRKAVSYIKKQLKNDSQKGNNKHFYHESQCLTFWKDYIVDCTKLEMDLIKEQVLFPRDLYTAHQNTITQVKVKENEIFDNKFKERFKALKKYCFEYNGIFIRPVTSTKELIEEGKALNHCVGTYAERHAKGSTNILVIRKRDKPERPYFTIEIRQDTVIQVRGKNNRPPDKDVSEFIDQFKQQKFKKEKQQDRISIPA